MNLRFDKYSAIYVLLVSAFFMFNTAQSCSDESIALTNGTLIDGSGNNPIADAVVVIRDGRIVASGRENSVEIPDGAEVIDLNGATILPGFINTHVHLSYENDAEKLRAFARAGVTTVRDMAGPLVMDSQWRETRNALRDDPQNAHILSATAMMTPPGGYPSVFEMEALFITSPEQARREVQKLIDAGADSVKIAVENGRVFMDAGGIPAELPTLSVTEISAIAAVAHANNVKVASHTTYSADLQALLEGGCDEIAHMVTDDGLSDELIAQIVEANVYWGPTMELWGVVDNVFESQGAPVNLYEPALENLRRFVEAGGNVVLGTDFGGFEPHPFELGMPMFEIESMLQAGMTPMQVIVAATKNAAHICNRDSDLGTLEVGKNADILVVQGNPLDDIQALANPLLVVHNGVIIRDERP